MKTNLLVTPIVKWAGGKRQLLDILLPLVPKKYSLYCEPFVGGGALLFRCQPKKAIINDSNVELMRVYEIVRDNVDALIKELKKFKNEEKFFYATRDLDRDRQKYEKISKIKKAARIIYLNKTCYNGLFRVNSAGEFNAPFGNYSSPNIINEPVLHAVSAYFNLAEMSFACGDYSLLLKKLTRNSFVYLDPPYDPVSDTAAFTGYTQGGFDKKEQIRLREFCDVLDNKNIRFLLSNSSTDFIRKQYKKYNIKTIQARRIINSVATKRGEIDEVVIWNYRL
jgi:DNA adenine methylase